ncbi:MAG TPA: prephenate dehydratase domain-containing protein, partial [Sphingomicrobium sp.]|nr:prephenate dehydratase domain-containing protein [Sphingomicrobium sp.]
MTVAYQGAEGAFSHEACLRFLPDHAPVAFDTFTGVIAAVQSGAVDLGMLPLANNEAGETGARELVEEARLSIV